MSQFKDSQEKISISLVQILHSLNNSSENHREWSRALLNVAYEELKNQLNEAKEELKKQVNMIDPKINMPVVEIEVSKWK